VFMIITYPWPVASANVELTWPRWPDSAASDTRAPPEPLTSARPLEQVIGWTNGERLRFQWYRFRIAVNDEWRRSRCTILRIHSHQDRTKKMRKIAGRNDETSSRITRIVVDFPAPLGPVNPVIWPGETADRALRPRAARVHGRARGPSRADERKREVLTAIARGLSNTEIVKRLHLSVPTVKTHIGRLLAKLGARNRAQLVITAYETGLVRAS
jgi:DNA-binding CsgD family transcriptional regulator